MEREAKRVRQMERKEADSQVSRIELSDSLYEIKKLSFRPFEELYIKEADAQL